MMQKKLAVPFSVFCSVFLLGGCASMIFPDFRDDTQVMIDDGGKVSVSKIEGKGIIIADKENAAYDDEEYGKPLIQDENVIEEITPAKVVKVEAEALESVADISDVEKQEVVADADNEDVKEEVVIAKVEPEKIESVKDMVEEEAPVEKVVTAQTMHYLAETIYFDNGSGEVDYKYYSKLKSLAKLAKDKDALVSVYGYASSRTRNTDPVSHKLANFNVSVKRADSVVKILQKYGVASEQIYSQALSDSAPMYQEVMPEGERLNRRVEIYLTY